MLHFGWKVAHGTKNSQILEEFCFLWCTRLTPQVRRYVRFYTLFEIWQQQRPLYFFMIFNVIPEVFLLHLMAIFQVLLLIIRLDDTNSKLLQPSISRICKVLVVEYPCVSLSCLKKGEFLENSPKYGKYINLVDKI